MPPLPAFQLIGSLLSRVLNYEILLNILCNGSARADVAMCPVALHHICWSSMQH